MGNCLRKKEEVVKKTRLRRIYVGNVPELNDEDCETPVGKKGRLERTSQQSFQDKDVDKLSSEQEAAPIPVRRQSIVGGQIKRQKPRNAFPNNTVTSSRYTFWSFLPKNLFEQFRRVVNAYFLVMAIIQSVTNSPVNPVTAVAPLAFVIVVTMIKQGYEDWLRHKADNLFNERPVNVIRDGQKETIQSKDVKVGDIVRLEGEEQVPTDMVVVGSSDEFQRCLINTANLDGETNLKLRYVPAGLPHFTNDVDFITLNLIIECEEPCEDLYRFDGNILITPDINMRRGSSLETIVEKPEPTEDDTKHIETNGTAVSHSHHPTHSHTSHAAPPNEVPTLHEFPVHPSSHEARKQRRVGVSDFNMIFLGMENVILRGTKLKNTDYVYGIVVYTGEDTRLARNSNQSSPKFSTVERTVNKYLLFFIVILAGLVVPATLVSVYVPWLGDHLPWYLRHAEGNKTFNYYFNIFASFLILFNYIIPISLYVTMEMQKFWGSKFFVYDQDMATENGDPPLCNTSDLNEELGQIEYLFSDKTGTLTENVMKSRIFSINAGMYDIFDGQLYLRDPENQSNKELKDVSESPELTKFCRTLALCHTVQIMQKRRLSVDASTTSPLNMNFLSNKKKKKKISSKIKNANSLFTIGETPEPIGMGLDFEFQASSPDEKALVEVCMQLGVTYNGERDEMLNLDVFGKNETYKRHMVLEFDADRKCMSVIIENEAGEIYLLTKGAETSIIPRCDTGPIHETNRDVQTFAMMGLRTLVIAERKLSKSQLDNYITRLKSARRLVENRDSVMRDIYRDIESHLNVIGATGVEDQLQEGVLETLHALGAAGIRVWMLTGDKVETGVAVAFACGLLTSFSKQIMICKYSANQSDEVIRRLTEAKHDMIPEDNNVLVIDGETIEVALKICPQLLCEVSMKAFRVICCRMTPLQKSQVVKMVKHTPSKPITAAVGDGANDVAMIQEAHIGIGIIGKEGRQAARCADFALARFGFLRKAILVHGHWYYVRLSNLANYFFYKNIVFVMPQVYYCFHSSFSTQALFDAVFLMMYNIFYTAAPILIYGLMEQNYPAKELLERPDLYKNIARNRHMTARVFFMWLAFAFWHSFVCYFFVYFSWTSFHPLNDLPSFGTVVFCSVVGVVNLKLIVETKFISWIFMFAEFCSFFAFFVFTTLYSEVDLRSIMIDPKQFRNVYFTVMSCPIFWILMILITLTALTPDLLWKAIEGSWSSVVKFFKCLPQKFKISSHQREKMSFPKISLLFSKRPSRLTISSATLHSYLSKEEL